MGHILHGAAPEPRGRECWRTAWRQWRGAERGECMAAGTGRGPWRVLVVDDEENLNWSLVNSLRKEGYTTDGALSGEDALRRLEAPTYDCILSDVKMPAMDRC